jgi:hypothetical protein
LERFRAVRPWSELPYTPRCLAQEVFGIQPDILCFAKGVTSGYQPLGGILISDRLLEGLLGVKDAKFMVPPPPPPGGRSPADRRTAWAQTGFTYSGHPVACAAALTNIEIFEEEVRPRRGGGPDRSAAPGARKSLITRVRPVETRVWPRAAPHPPRCTRSDAHPPCRSPRAR